MARYVWLVRSAYQEKIGEGGKPPYFFYKKVLTDENEYDKIGGPRAIAASGFHYNTRLALLSSGNFAQKLQKNIPKFVYFAQRKIFFVTFHKIFVYLCTICTL